MSNDDRKIPALAEQPPPRTPRRAPVDEPPRMSRRDGVSQAATTAIPEEFIDPDTGEPFRRKSLTEQKSAWNELDKKSVRNGWCYQWNPVRVLNEPVDASQARALRDGGWRPVHPREMPDECPPGWTGDTIERHGQILYKRPAYLNEEARRESVRLANAQVKDRFAAAEMTPRGTLPKVVETIKQTIEPLPDDLQRERADLLRARAAETGELQVEEV